MVFSAWLIVFGSAPPGGGVGQNRRTAVHPALKAKGQNPSILPPPPVAGVTPPPKGWKCLDGEQWSVHTPPPSTGLVRLILPPDCGVLHADSSFPPHFMGCGLHRSESHMEIESHMVPVTECGCVKKKIVMGQRSKRTIRNLIIHVASQFEQF